MQLPRTEAEAFRVLTYVVAVVIVVIIVVAVIRAL